MLHAIAALAIVHLVVLHFAAITPVIGAGTDPFAGLGQALLDIANTFKLPFAILSIIITGAAYAFHDGRASALLKGSGIANALLFGSTSLAAYLQANVK